VRFATPDSLERYWRLSDVGGQLSEDLGIAGRIRQLKSSRTLVDRQAALEESFFLGLRLNCGVSIPQLRSRFGDDRIDRYSPVIAEFVGAELLQTGGNRVQLTPRGRLLSNEVFARFLQGAEAMPRPPSVLSFDNRK